MPLHLGEIHEDLLLAIAFLGPARVRDKCIRHDGRSLVAQSRNRRAPEAERIHEHVFVDLPHDFPIVEEVVYDELFFRMRSGARPVSARRPILVRFPWVP